MMKLGGVQEGFGWGAGTSSSKYFDLERLHTHAHTYTLYRQLETVSTGSAPFFPRPLADLEMGRAGQGGLRAAGEHTKERSPAKFCFWILPSRHSSLPCLDS